MFSPVEEIKSRLDIVELIRSYIPLQPAGRNFKAVCPFHKEKTPSFIVSPEKQMWHCFGACAEGGDIFKFVMKYENLEFYEALKVLAEKAGVELKRLSPIDQKQFGILYDINEEAKDYFIKQLEISPEIMKYALSRGLQKETIDEFELGFAPTNYDSLNLYLLKKGFNVKDIERSGLGFKNERGSYMDRFRGRLMFPIYNSFGKVVAFSGRIMPQFENENTGKYVNSPETPIFNKSRVLYGFHKTKNNIREQNSALLVEGQMDFLMTYQDGVKNVVATSGTALTPDHLNALRRLTDRLILSFDNDEAGLKAAERGIDLAGASDFNVELLILPGGKDPAEIAAKSPGQIISLVSQTTPAMEFYFNRYLSDAAGQSGVPSRSLIGDLKNKLRIILSKIKNLASAIEQNHWLKRLSEKVKIDEKALMEEMERMKAEISRDQFKNPIDYQNKMEKTDLSRRDLIAERILSLIAGKEELKERLNGYLEYLPADYLLILENLRAKNLEDERLQNLLNLIILRSSFELGLLGEEGVDEEFQELSRQLQLEDLKEKRNVLSQSIKEAERAGDESGVNEMLKQFDEISKLMQNK